MDKKLSKLHMYVLTILFSKGVVVISTATHVSMLKISDNVY